MEDAPQDYKTAGIFMMVAGGLNIVIPFMLWVASGCLMIWAVLAIGAGVAELVFGYGVMQGQPKPQAKAVSIVGLITALLVCNWISVVMEILAQVWFSKDEVQAWLMVNQ